MDGAVLMGMPRTVAVELAAQSMLGTATMILAGEGASSVRDAITTPGGCTIAGLHTLEAGNIRHTLATAVKETSLVASKLGQRKNE